MFNLSLRSSAKKFLKHCDAILTKRISFKLESLRSNPFPSDCKRVENQEEKIFRVRVGDYRILYSVSFEKNLIFVEDIDTRSNVYKIKEEAEEYSKNSLELGAISNY